MPQKCFISSTVLDLKDLRDFLEYELSKHGFQMLLSEKGTIPADSSKHTYDACIDAAKNCDILIAIIDGRYGGDVPGTGKSITQVEVEAALDAGRQVRVFVRKGVWDAKEILKPYFADKVDFKPSKIVSDERVFGVIDAIRRRTVGNWIFQFDAGADLLRQLSAQLGFELNLADDKVAVEQLDKIVARRFLNTFTEGFITEFSHGLQIGQIFRRDSEYADESLQRFSTEAMRFTQPDLDDAMLNFLKEFSAVVYEAPSAFRSGADHRLLVWRSAMNSEGQRYLDQRQIEVGELAVTMERAWRAMFAVVRAAYPDLVADLLQQSESM